MSSPRLEAIVFDWGGTLSRWADLDVQDVWRLAARHLHPAREDELVARLVEVEQRFWQRVEQTQQSSRLSELLEVATREVGLDVTEAVLEEAATHHLDAWTPHVIHDETAPAVLAELRARGLKLGLLSNTMWPRAWHEHFLERDGLRALLDATLYTSEMPFTKPHPAAFRSALDALDVADAGAGAFVGDRGFDDILGASRVGMRTIHRPNPLVPAYDVAPDATISDLRDILAVIEPWL